MKTSKKIFRTDFMSDVDQFLRRFDEKRAHLPLPVGRLQEVAKHKAIFAKRDTQPSKK